MLFSVLGEVFHTRPIKSKAWRFVGHLNEDGKHPLMNIVWRQKKNVENIFNHVHRIKYFLIL
jgi:hypothetical protein